jgi:streptolysin S family bacteriocin protoxin
MDSSGCVVAEEIAMRAPALAVLCSTFCCFSVAHGQTSVRTSGAGPEAYIFNGRLTPFVSQIIPVVGSPPQVVFESPLKGKLRMAGGVARLSPPLRRPEADESPGRAAYETPTVDDRAAGPEHSPARAAGSSAVRGDFSVAAIRRQQANDELELQAELDRLETEAARLARLGDRRGAALIYSKAAAKVEDQRRQEFLAKARQLRGS